MGDDVWIAEIRRAFNESYWDAINLHVRDPLKHEDKILSLERRLAKQEYTPKNWKRLCKIFSRNMGSKRQKQEWNPNELKFKDFRYHHRLDIESLPMNQLVLFSSCVRKHDPIDELENNGFGDFLDDLEHGCDINITRRKRHNVLSKRKSSLPTLVIDLDETLIHSFDHKRKHCKKIIIDDDEDVDYYWVSARPYCIHFLEVASEHFEMILWTASDQAYADAILHGLGLDQFFDYCLYRHHCTKVKGRYVKDLRRLGRNLDNVIILDNSPISYAWHMSSAVPIHSYVGDFMNDVELLEMISFLKLLKHQNDVRPFLKRTFRISKISSMLRNS